MQLHLLPFFFVETDPFIGDQPETCAVCLDDFIEGEKLRILPCKHGKCSAYCVKVQQSAMRSRYR